MEFGMRDWLFLIGALMIFGVCANMAWMYWRDRRSDLGTRYEREIPEVDIDDIDLLRGELPSGGARIAPRDGEPGNLDGPAAAHGQVPVLMDPIDQDLSSVAPPQAREVEPDPAPAPAPAVADAPAEVAQPEAAPEPGFEQAPLFTGEPIVPRAEPRKNARRSRSRAQEPQGSAEAGASGQRAEGTADDRPQGPPDEVIVINILCRGDSTVAGSELLETITDHGLRFGDMNIFHRHSPSDRSRIDFSVASAVEPGTFDLSAMSEFETPGVTLFMQLPGPANPLDAFEDMVSIARGVATRIGADLKDERHSVMTAQTIEHCRQRVREFTRLQRMSRRS